MRAHGPHVEPSTCLLPVHYEEGEHMSNERISPDRGARIAALGLIGSIGLVVFAFGMQLDGDISADSEIVLSESNGARYTLRVRSVDSSTVISVERGGDTTEVAIPHEACESLWNYCLDRDATRLEDARANPLPPDQSTFTLTFRVGTTAHSFSAVGVDFLEDRRYREIIREILDTCNRYLPQEP